MSHSQSAAPAGPSPLRLAINATWAEARRLVPLMTVLVGMVATLYTAWQLARYGIYAFVVTTKSMEVLAGFSVLILFICAIMACLEHVTHWFEQSWAHRAGLRLSAPAVQTAVELRGRDGADPRAALDDVETAEAMLTGSLPELLANLARSPLGLAVMFYVNWMVTLFLLAISAVRILISYYAARATRRRLAEANSSISRTFAAMGDATAAGEAVDAMGLLPRLAARWVGEIAGGGDRLGSAMRIVRIAAAVNGFLANATLLGVFVINITQDWSAVAVGNFLLLMMLMRSAIGPLDTLDRLGEEVRNGIAASNRLKALADAPPFIPARQSAFPCPAGRLVVQQLMVGFPGQNRPILNSLSLVVEPGEIIGIAGPIGCGKSTLLRAIMGIQIPNAGGCYLDGHATWQWDRTDFARHVGYLPQEVGIADATVAEVIARLEVPDMALVIEAARRAGAHETIVALPQGYSTRLTEHSLSAGQRQRVALARAIYGRPRLVVLDEPSAWLDSQGIASLRRLMAVLKADGTSVLFTSHDLSLMKAADQVYALGATPKAPRPQPQLAGSAA